MGFPGEQLGWSGPAERLAGPVVDLVRDPLKLLGTDAAKVDALREVVAQQPVHVLVAAALPRRVRIAEEHLRADLLGDLLMQSQLLALIPGQRSPQLWRQLAERRGDALAHRLGRGPAARDVDQHQEPRAALDERADRGPVTRPDNAVTFPMAELDAVLDLRRPLADHRHRGQPA